MNIEKIEQVYSLGSRHWRCTVNISAKELRSSNVRNRFRFDFAGRRYCFYTKVTAKHKKKKQMQTTINKEDVAQEIELHSMNCRKTRYSC